MPGAKNVKQQKQAFSEIPRVPPKKKRGNVRVPDAWVPDDFPDHAKRLGFETRILLWQLAEAFCANPPASIQIVEALDPSKIIAFPREEEA